MKRKVAIYARVLTEHEAQLSALNIREQCIRKNVNFEFRQCGTHTIKNGKQYNIQTKDLIKQAKLANINYRKS